MIECILVRASIRFEAFLWVYIVDYANELIFAHQLYAFSLALIFIIVELMESDQPGFPNLFYTFPYILGG